MKHFLILIAIFGTSIHAETEDEFIARVTAAWESKDPNKVIAIYGDAQKLDPEFVKAKRTRLELEFKTNRIKSACIVPFLPPGNATNIAEKNISSFPADITKCVSHEFFNEELGRSTWSAIPISKDKEGRFSYALQETRTFEWNGSKPSQFGISIKYGNCRGIIAVTETCGHVNWEAVGGSFGGFRAHKILQLIVPPTSDGNAISFEISKDDAEPFFKKTIDTTKGAVIPIDIKAP